VEVDRTRRVDKNFGKFRRYDAFLTWWWRYTEFADIGVPLVMFTCQHGEQREQFLRAADLELTGPPLARLSTARPARLHRPPSHPVRLRAGRPRRRAQGLKVRRFPPGTLRGPRRSGACGFLVRRRRPSRVSSR
jgi:hypothetical protein